MVNTRKITSFKRRSYARRRKMSACRGLATSTCGNRTACSYASGFYRQFCRRKNNTPHHISLPAHSMSKSVKKKRKKASPVTTLRRSERIKNRNSAKRL